MGISAHLINKSKTINLTYLRLTSHFGMQSFYTNKNIFLFETKLLMWVNLWHAFLPQNKREKRISFVSIANHPPHRYMIESPRWLIIKKNFAGCAKVLQHIAKINGHNADDLTENHLRKMLPESRMEKIYGVASLFSSRRLTINTLLLVNCW